MRNETAVFQDYALIMSVLFLVGIGLVLLYSTSSYEAALKYGDSAYYLKRQLVFSVLGTGLMFFISIFPVALFRRLELFIYGFSTLLLLLIIPFGGDQQDRDHYHYVLADLQNRNQGSGQNQEFRDCHRPRGAAGCPDSGYHEKLKLRCNCRHDRLRNLLHRGPGL